MVIPLYKKESKSNMCNYWPISLLSTLCKILEKLMKKRLMTFLEKYKFLSRNQYGFRSKKSTLISFSENIYKSVNDKMKCSALFIDITKAFDMVDHELLLRHIWDARIRGFTICLGSKLFRKQEAVCKIGRFLEWFVFIKTRGASRFSVRANIIFDIHKIIFAKETLMVL